VEDNIVLPAYRNFFNEIKQRIKSSQASAAIAVNSALIQLYWSIGKLIAEKQSEHSWGTNVIERLSRDLKAEFPGTSGFSARNLRDTKRFYLFYSSEIWRQVVAKLDYLSNPDKSLALNRDEVTADQHLIFMRQLVAQIPWGHHLLILNKVNEPGEALFYIRQTIENNWSRAILTLQIEQKLISRQGKAISNFKETLPEQQALLAQQILKDPYNFSFLTLEPKVHELELEKQLTEHITRFLLELGKGFAFIGRQYSLRIGEKEYWLDLLFYHIRLRCFVVIDLKVTSFEPEYAGKMNFYLSAVDDLLKTAFDQPSIGILLCKGKESLEVEYTLRDITKPIGVSEFVFAEALPEELKSSMPTVEEFEQEINRLSDTSH
jgi:predicted nuclease of restriction endonuclease-like (RecB) superfamily